MTGILQAWHLYTGVCKMIYCIVEEILHNHIATSQGNAWYIFKFYS